MPIARCNNKRLTRATARFRERNTEKDRERERARAKERKRAPTKMLLYNKLRNRKPCSRVPLNMGKYFL